MAPSMPCARNISVWQGVAECCRVLQGVVVWRHRWGFQCHVGYRSALQFVAVCCRVLQGVAYGVAV